MDSLIARQMEVLRDQIKAYRKGVLNLHLLIQQVEAISGIIDVESWRNSVFPIILAMEEVNAITLEAKRRQTHAEKTLIDKSLLDLEKLSLRFEGDPSGSAT